MIFLFEYLHKNITWQDFSIYTKYMLCVTYKLFIFNDYIVSKINNEGMDVFGFSPYYDGIKNTLSEHNNFLVLNPVFIFAKTSDLLKVGIDHCWPKNKLIFGGDGQLALYEKVKGHDPSNNLLPNYSWNLKDRNLVKHYKLNWFHVRIGWNWLNTFGVEHGIMSNYLYDIGKNICTLYQMQYLQTNFKNIFEKNIQNLELPPSSSGAIAYHPPTIVHTGTGGLDQRKEFIYHGPWRIDTITESDWAKLVMESNPDLKDKEMVRKKLQEIELGYLNGYFESNDHNKTFEEWDTFYCQSYDVVG